MKVWFFDDFAVQFLVIFRWFSAVDELRGGYRLQVLQACAGLQRPEEIFSVRRLTASRRNGDDVDVFDIKKQVVFMYFWFFTPKIAEMIPNLTHIFFRWVGEKPPTGCFIGNRIYTPKNWNGTWKCLRKEKEKHLHTTNFGVSHVNVWGCTLPETNSKFTPERWWQREIILSRAISA